MERMKNIPEESIFLLVPQRANQNDQQLNKSRDHGRDRRARDAQPREAQITENEEQIQHEVDRHRRDGRDHRERRLPRLAHRAAQHLRKAERIEPHQHDQKVRPRVVHRLRSIGRRRVRRDIPADHPRPACEEKDHRNAHDHRHNDDLDPHRDAHAFFILLSEKLRAVDARAGQRPEDTQIEHEKHLVHDRHRRHRQRADAPDHDVIQKADDVGQRILQHHGQNDRRGAAVEIPVSDQCFPQRDLYTDRLFAGQVEFVVGGVHGGFFLCVCFILFNRIEILLFRKACWGSRFSILYIRQRIASQYKDLKQSSPVANAEHIQERH